MTWSEDAAATEGGLRITVIFLPISELSLIGMQGQAGGDLVADIQAFILKLIHVENHWLKAAINTINTAINRTINRTSTLRENK